MASNDDETSENTVERSHRIDSNSPGNDMRQEPSFSNFEDLHEDGYEEPDRDTNFTSGYRADSVEDEEEFDAGYSDDEEQDPLADDRPIRGHDSDGTFEDDPDSWLEQEDDLEGDEEDDHQAWPLGLIAVAILAVVLLAAGGYGVMQQRAATQEELRELRAALAVSASPGDVGASRDALEELQQSYDKLYAEAQALTLENRRLADTVAGMEMQLGTRQSIPAKPATAGEAKSVSDQSSAQQPAAVAEKASVDAVSPQVATATTTALEVTTATPPPVQPSTASKPVAPVPAQPSPTAGQPVATQTTGPWFVNFGSYATRTMADTWSSRLRPIAGEVIVAPSDRDGRTLYRVRVIGLADRETAQQVARNLEAELRVSQLWVGRE